jgi:hypothetical protein
VSSVPVVRKGIAKALRRLEVGIGYCSGARGSDLIFVDEMLKRGGEVNILLPFPREAFARTSIGEDWQEEFDALVEREGLWVTELSDTVPEGEEALARAYADCNREVMERAVARAAQLDQEPVLIHVWNGAPGDGRGGTADFIRTWTKRGFEAVGVDLPEPDA